MIVKVELFLNHMLLNIHVCSFLEKPWIPDIFEGFCNGIFKIYGLATTGFQILIFKIDAGSCWATYLITCQPLSTHLPFRLRNIEYITLRNIPENVNSIKISELFHILFNFNDTSLYFSMQWNFWKVLSNLSFHLILKVDVLG